MIARKRIVLIAAAFSAGVYEAGAQGFEGYSSGFYTRGLDTAQYMDQGSGIFHPYYESVRDVAVLPRITVTLTHDDNITLSSDDPEASTTIDAAPGLMLMYGRPERSYAYLDLAALINLYDRSGELDGRDNYLATLGFAHRKPKTVFGARAGYRYAEEIDTIIGERVVRDSFVVDAHAEQTLSEKTSIGGAADVQFKRYDADRYFDSAREYAGIRLIRKMMGKSDGYLQAGAGREEVDASQSTGDSDFYDLLLGFRGRQSARFNWSGSVGYHWQDLGDSASTAVDRWVADLRAEMNPMGLSTFFAGLSSDLNPSAESAGQSTADQRVTVGVERRLFSERLRGNVSGFFGTIDYEGEPLDEFASFENRSDEYWGYNLGLDYWTVDSFSVGLDYSFFKNDGQRDGSREQRDDATYDTGRWVLRASWNY